MIVYVDLEHDRVRQQPEHYEQVLSRRLKAKYRFEEISGDLCLIVRYTRVSPALLRELNARAVLVSGCDTEFQHYDEKDLAGLRAILQEAAWPTLGFCAGHQIMAQTYGAPIDAIGPLPPGAPDPYRASGYPAGIKQECGFVPVRVAQRHTLFDGLGRLPTFFESHYWEVKAPLMAFTVSPRPTCAPCK